MENKQRTLEPTSYIPMERYYMEVSYDGGCFAGWQIQPNGVTVQETIQRILTKLYDNMPIHVLGASRTDAGVHSLGFAASFLVPQKPYIPCDRLLTVMNRQLPPSIRIRQMRKTDLMFHARYDAAGKAYTYVFNRGLETPFANRYSWSCRYKMDFEKMAKAAQVLVGTLDYSSFVVERGNIDDAVRTIYSITKQEFGNYVCFTYIGNGFLYKMIRCLTGALSAVGSGRLEIEELKRILDAKDRNIAPETAPAHGLFLMKTFFDEEELKKFRLETVPFYC